MAKKQDTNQYQEAMNEYANRFKVLTTDAEKIHQTPDVYIGDLGNKGYLTMVREIIQNSFDIIAKSLRDPSIKILDPIVNVTVNDMTKEVTIEDHGSGIPFGMLETIFGNTHSSSNYDKQNGDYDAGKNGCGSTVVNCLSEYFIVESHILGVGGRRVEFKEGIPVAPEHDIPSSGKQGTVICFKPSIKYMGEITLPWQEIYALIKLIVPLTAIGTTVNFTAYENNKKKPIMETIINKDGILMHLVDLTTTPMIPEIRLYADNGEMKLDAIFTFSGKIEEARVLSFCNTCPTIDGGTHVDGTLIGITKWFKDYMNKIYLANTKSKLVIIDSDIRQGLNLVISAYLINAKYTGQSKEKLATREMATFCKQAAYDCIEEWSKTHSTELKKMCEFFKDVGQLRMSQEKSTSKITAKYSKSALNKGLPKKFVPANNKKHLELFLVEGDSALGTAKSACNHDVQALYPFRGKLLNAFTTTRAKMFDNEEISGLVNILGIQPANPAKHQPCEDISKCPYDKIIFFADADDDGAHIDTLWLIFFIVYYPDLIKAGRVYRCVPPLYGASVAGKMKFFPDDFTFFKYVQQEFCKSYEIADADTKAKMAPKDIIGLLMRNKNFVDILNSCSKPTATHPILLEQIIRNRNLTMAKFKKAIETKFPYLTVSEYNKKRLITGAFEDKMYTTYVDDLCLPMSAPCFSYIDNEKPYYLVDGNKKSLYELCAMFKGYTPKVTRYKGLGENLPSTLAKTAVLPGSYRTLIQYTLENAEEQIMEMRNIISNKNLFLQNIPEECKDL